MRAVSWKNSRLALSEVETPEPRSGEVLVRTLACAICASDHHYMDHPEVSRDDQTGMRVDAPEHDVVMGHEFCAEVVAYGPDTQQQWPIGTRVTAMPILLRDGRVRIIGMTPESPGGFGEYFLLTEVMTREVPDSIPVEHIAVNDAMAVGWFYSRVGVETSPPGSVPMVVGLGAIGQSVVASLKHRGAGPIVAVDFSAARRELALELGADVVVDPAAEDPWAAWRRVAWDSPEPVFDRFALMGRPVQVVYEMVGRNGMLAEIVDHCEASARILSCGGAAEDLIHTTVAHLKGLNIQIGGGPSPEDWYGCLDLIVSGQLDVSPLVGATVSLDELPDAIEYARSSDAPVRIVYVADR